MKLSEIRRIALNLSGNMERDRQTLKNLGLDPEGVDEFIQSKQNFLNALLTTNPPPELEYLLDKEIVD